MKRGLLSFPLSICLFHCLSVSSSVYLRLPISPSLCLSFSLVSFSLSLCLSVSPSLYAVSVYLNPIIARHRHHCFICWTHRRTLIKIYYRQGRPQQFSQCNERGSSRRMNCFESRWYCIGSLSAVVQYKFIYQSFYLPVNLFSRVIIYHSIPGQFCAISSEPSHPNVAGQLILLFVFLLGAAPERGAKHGTQK